jgi:REP element-mobilizing transposase RayT
MSVTRQIIEVFGGRPTIWQRNYYEHIIRDERDHQSVHDYIVSNPINWETDSERRR